MKNEIDLYKKFKRDSFIYSCKFMHIDEDVFYFLQWMINHVQMMDDFDTLVMEEILMLNEFLILHEPFHNHTYRINI